MANAGRVMKKSYSFGAIADLGLSLQLPRRLRKNVIGHTDGTGNAKQPLSGCEDTLSVNSLDVVSTKHTAAS